MSDQWLPTELAKLFASPHISFPKPPPNIHLGPGPIDLFSTVFNNIFASNVEATVDGQKVSRDVLKQKCLNLQKHWNPEKVKFEDDSSTPPVRRLRFNRWHQMVRFANIPREGYFIYGRSSLPWRERLFQR